MEPAGLQHLADAHVGQGLGHRQQVGAPQCRCALHAASEQIVPGQQGGGRAVLGVDAGPSSPDLRIVYHVVVMESRDVQGFDDRGAFDDPPVRAPAGFFGEQVRGQQDERGPQQTPRVLHRVGDGLLDPGMRLGHQGLECLPDPYEVLPEPFLNECGFFAVRGRALSRNRCRHHEFLPP